MTKLLTATALVMLTAAPAMAGVAPAAPGPLVGAGVPALIGLAYLYRRFRRTR